MCDRARLSFAIPDDLAGKQLGQALAILLPKHSPAQIREWIKQGDVRVDKQRLLPSDMVRSGVQIEIDATVKLCVAAHPEAIPLDVVFADESFIVVNKPAGLVMHPGAGNPRHTLMNALLYYDLRLAQLPRAGIVHRLDQHTSGLLIVARTHSAYTALVDALKARTIRRQYIAIVVGVFIAGGTIEAAIGRHPKHRTKMAITPHGRPATTHYRIIKKYRSHTMVGVELETGRTHQIRVHMTSLNHPLVGDPMYHGGRRFVKGMRRELAEIIAAFPRQALHAHRVELSHPRTGELVVRQRAIPEDMAILAEALEADADSR